MEELAKSYGLKSRSSVWSIIHKIENFLAVHFISEIRKIKIRSTERLELIFARSMQSYVRSCEDAVTITTTKEAGQKEDGVDKVTEREQRVGQAGSAALLAQAREAVSEILKIWGGYAPNQSEVAVSADLRIAGRTREEALMARITHLQDLHRGLTVPNAN